MGKPAQVKATRRETDAERIARLEGLIEGLRGQTELAAQTAAQAAASADKPVPWWTKWVAFLALPAAILGIWLQLEQSQANKDAHLKTMSDLSLAQIQFAAQKADDQAKHPVAAPQTPVSIPGEAPSAAAVQAQEAESAKDLIQHARLDLLLKIAVVGIFLTATSLVFDILSQAWSWAINAIALSTISIQNRLRRANSARGRRFADRVQSFMPIGFAILGPLPGLLRWAVSITIFFALSAPLFDAASAALGSNVRMDAILHSAKKIDVGGALAQMRSIIVPPARGATP